MELTKKIRKVFEKHLEHRKVMREIGREPGLEHRDEYVVTGEVEDFYTEVMRTVLDHFKKRLEALAEGKK